MDETTNIPFNSYLFNVIKNADKSLLLNDISYSQTITNQNFLRNYFQNQYSKINLKYNDYVSLFAFYVIYDKHHKNVTSWKQVGEVFYKLVTDGFKFGINNPFALLPSERICMCSNHSPKNYFNYNIDNKYRLIAGSVCVNKNKIVDKNIINKMNRDEKEHSKKQTDIKKFKKFIDNIKDYELDKQTKIIGLYQILHNANSSKGKNKLIKTYNKII